MPTPETDAAGLAGAADPQATGGSFLPDAAIIERLANAIFKGVTGGAPIGQPAIPTSAPAPWSPPSPPTASAIGQVVPVQPPFGVIDPPVSSLPASAPARSFGGASAGSATPATTQAGHIGLPAAGQTLVTRPRIDPTIAIDSPVSEASASPFAAEIDFRAALATLRAGLPGHHPLSAPESAAPPRAWSEAKSPAAARDASAPDFPDVAATPATPAAPTALAAAPQAIAPKLADAGAGPRVFDAASIRSDFPILQEKVHGRRLIWLDNGATTQKPQAVIDRLAFYYAHENSNVHRGAHTLAARSTDAYEAARDKVRRFVNASSSREIVFVRGATEGINLVAQSWGRRNVREGDEIVVTWLEHHANIVPWQQLCAATGAELRVAPVDDRGDVKLDEYEKLLGARTRIVALTSVSNALGTVTPAAEMIAMAHRHGALALVDGAQSVSHRRTDVQALDADFLVFSGHKMFAPTGIGVVYGKQAILDATPPWQGGGNMIADVTFERTLYQAAPERFEAGTGNIADAVGLGAAIDYIERIGLTAIERHEHDLIECTVAGLAAIPGARLIGAPRERAGVVSFVLDGRRAEDVGKALDAEGIAVRAGHHCAQPILRRFGLEATVRPSFALYNTREDVEALLVAVRRIAVRAHGGSR
jgi:cysteine desulfurase/selenocysteine lyase